MGGWVVGGLPRAAVAALLCRLAIIWVPLWGAAQADLFAFRFQVPSGGAGAGVGELHRIAAVDVRDGHILNVIR